MKNKVVLIAGGSASGKSTLTKILSERLNGECCVVKIDSFCISRDDISFEERKKINYDLPSSYESEKMIPFLLKLQNGESVDLPIYDFSKHLRSNKTEHIVPKKYILVEGLFALYYEELLKLGDYKVFMRAPENIRFERRLNRDVKERGRSPESVKIQFTTQVGPMHKIYVERTSKNADLIVENTINKQIKEEYINEIIKNIKF